MGGMFKSCEMSLRRNGPEARIKELREFREPVTKRDMRSFLGTVGYYRKSIHRFADRAKSLTAVTKKARVEWTAKMENYFMSIRDSLYDVSVLIVPVESDVFVVQTDASGVGVSGVLRWDYTPDVASYPGPFTRAVRAGREIRAWYQSFAHA